MAPETNISAKNIFVWHDSYSWCSPQTISSVFSKIAISSTSPYLSGSPEISCGGAYSLTTDGTFNEFMFVVTALDIDSGRWDATTSKYPLEFEIDNQGAFKITTSFENGSPTYKRVRGNITDYIKHISTYTWELIEETNDVFGDPVQVSRKIKYGDTSPAPTAKSSDDVWDVTTSFAYIDYEDSTALAAAYRKYEHPMNICISGGTNQILLSADFFKKHQANTELENDRPTYIGQYQSSMEITSSIYFENDEWKVKFSKFSEGELVETGVLYTSSQPLMNPCSITHWKPSSEYTSVESLSILPTSCDNIIPDLLCVQHESKNATTLQGFYSLVKRDEETPRKYNNKIMYWSIFDEPKTLADLGISNFDNNTSTQSQIWWQGSYWVLNYRKNTGNSSTPVWGPMKLAYFSFDDVELPSDIRNWKVFDKDTFGKMKSVHVDTCPTPTPSPSHTPSPTFTPSPTVTASPTATLTPCEPIEVGCGDVKLHLQANDHYGITIRDRSLFQNKLQLVDHVTFSRDTMGPLDLNQQSFYFDGQDDLIRVEVEKTNVGTDIMQFRADAFTIELFVKFNTLNQNQPLISYGDAENCWWRLVYVKSADRLEFLYVTKGNGLVKRVNISANLLEIDTWYHIVLTRNTDINQFLIYIDGVERGSSIETEELDYSENDNIVYIGSNFRTQQTEEEEYFNGYMQEIRVSSECVYECAFNPITELNDVCYEGTPTPSPSPSATVTPSPTFTPSPTHTPSPSPSPSETPSPSHTPSPSPSPSETPTNE